MSLHLAQSMLAQGFPLPPDLVKNLPFVASKVRRRQSRGSKSSPRGSSPIKVTKSTSTHSSPRERIAAARQTYQQQQQPVTTMAMPVEYTQTSRPVSWHPASFHQAMQYQQQQAAAFHHFSQQMPAPYYPQQQQHFQQPSPDVFSACAAQQSYSPAQTAYSNEGSPCSFVNVGLPAQCGGDFGAIPSYIDIPTWDLAQPMAATAGYLPTTTYSDFLPAAPAGYIGTPPMEGLDWASFAMNAFSLNAPPTPEVLSQPMMVMMPELDATGSVSSDDEEDDGEVLVGMGLYDDDDDDKKLSMDSGLDRARSMSMLMGGGGAAPTVPAGKGLRLEETWQPPKTEDDEEEAEE
jgi:hypothetical protein